MRLIASLEKQDLAKRFSLFLNQKDIENIVEESYDKNLKKTVYGIWVHDEDDLPKATRLYNEYIEDPSNSKYEVKYQEKKVEEPKESKQIVIEAKKADPFAQKSFYPYKITFFILLVCIGLYFINFMQEINILKKYKLKELILLTPIQKALLYDLPQEREQIEQVIIKYNLDTEKKLEDPPAEAKKEVMQIEKMPSWIGLSDVILQKFQKQKTQDYKSAPLFEKIRKGEVYRLFTPVLLHSGFLHILFNMLWLWYLGKQMEPRLRFTRYILFIIIVGVISNTFQYLMGGPYFLGYSGIITGMVGYIFIREKIAPWEGYNIPKAVFYFISIFILAMFFLQLGSFVLQIFKPKLGFTPGIANTAHIVGAIVGMILAKIPFFSWRAK